MVVEVAADSAAAVDAPSVVVAEGDPLAAAPLSGEAPRSAVVPPFVAAPVSGAAQVFAAALASAGASDSTADSGALADSGVTGSSLASVTAATIRGMARIITIPIGTDTMIPTPTITAITAADTRPTMGPTMGPITIRTGMTTHRAGLPRDRQRRTRIAVIFEIPHRLLLTIPTWAMASGTISDSEPAPNSPAI